MKKIAVIQIAVLLLVARVFVHPGTPTLVDGYKDAAHLFVGGLFVAWRIQRQPWQRNLFFIMCGWEVFVAFGSRLLW